MLMELAFSRKFLIGEIADIGHAGRTVFTVYTRKLNVNRKCGAISFEADAQQRFES